MDAQNLASMSDILSTKNVFGWHLEYCFLASGGTYKTVTPTGGMLPSQLQKAALMIKGRITGVREDGSPTYVKTPGVMIRGLKDFVIPGGEATFTAEEDSYWWCLKTGSNPEGIPDTDTFCLTKGSTQELPVGTRLILCFGELSVDGRAVQAIDDPVSPVPVGVRVTTEAKTVTAVTDCFGYLIDRELG